MVKSSQQVYVEQLMPRVAGYPLWNPEPPESLPSEVKEVGIVPGDVGYLTPDGDFFYLFHVFSGPGAPRKGNPNPYGTPTGFSPIEVQAGDDQMPIFKSLRPYTDLARISSVTDKRDDIFGQCNFTDLAR
jgi:hypothetical protein